VLTDIAWVLGAITVCAGLFYLAYRMEPHWVARDGTRFLTTAQPIDKTGRTFSRKREMRVAILPGGDLMLSRRSLVRSKSSMWRVHGKSPAPPKGKEVYLLRSITPDPNGDMMTLRVPRKSRVVATMDDLIPGPVSAPAPDPGSRQSDQPADRG